MYTSVRMGRHTPTYTWPPVIVHGYTHSFYVSQWGGRSPDFCIINYTTSPRWRSNKVADFEWWWNQVSRLFLCEHYILSMCVWSSVYAVVCMSYWYIVTWWQGSCCWPLFSLEKISVNVAFSMRFPCFVAFRLGGSGGRVTNGRTILRRKWRHTRNVIR